MRLLEYEINKLYEELIDKVYNKKTFEEDLSLLAEIEKVFYVLYTFDLEWCNGGLCQFFSNSSGEFAPYISDYLEIVGATEHKKLYDDFIKDNEIDVNDLSFFKIEDLNEYKDIANAYPFEDFDDEFSNLDELADYIEKYYIEKMKK